MPSCHCQNCDEHQNSSFTFGLILGLIIGAIIAVIIYKNNKEKVFDDLKKKLENFFESFKPKSKKIIESFITPDLPSKKVLKKKKKNFSTPLITPEPLKKEVVIPQKLIAQNSAAKAPVSKSKPRTFKK